MRLHSLPYYDMTPGPEIQVPLEAGGERLAATICYEDAYGADQLAALPASTLLVNVTNNAWFGDSSAPHQQLQMARFRALEAGRWLMRATSNGITAVIAPDGKVTARIPQFEPGILKYDRAAAHGPHALRPHRQLAHPLVLLPAADRLCDRAPRARRDS